MACISGSSLVMIILLIVLVDMGISMDPWIQFTPNSKNDKEKLKRIIEQSTTNSGPSPMIIEGKADGCSVVLAQLMACTSQVNDGKSIFGRLGQYAQRFTIGKGSLRICGNGVVKCKNPSSSLSVSTTYQVSFMADPAINALKKKDTFIKITLIQPNTQNENTQYGYYSQQQGEPGLVNLVQLTIHVAGKKATQTVQGAAAASLQVPRYAVGKLQSAHQTASNMLQKVNDRIGMAQQNLRPSNGHHTVQQYSMYPPASGAQQGYPPASYIPQGYPPQGSVNPAYPPRPGYVPNPNHSPSAPFAPTGYHY